MDVAVGAQASHPNGAETRALGQPATGFESERRSLRTPSRGHDLSSVLVHRWPTGGVDVGACPRHREHVEPISQGARPWPAPHGFGLIGRLTRGHPQRMRRRRSDVRGRAGARRQLPSAFPWMTDAQARSQSSAATALPTPGPPTSRTSLSGGPVVESRGARRTWSASPALPPPCRRFGGRTRRALGGRSAVRRDRRSPPRVVGSATGSPGRGSLRLPRRLRTAGRFLRDGA